MTEAARLRQAALQEALIRSLTGDGRPPEGVDRDRLAASARTLAVKRSRSVAAIWPSLAASLDDRFATEFAEFAATVSLPARGGPLADGWAFARWLTDRGTFPSAARIERLSVALRFRETSEGLEPRRGPVVRVAWMAPHGQPVLAARWAGRFEFWIPLWIPHLRLGPSAGNSAEDV